MNNDYLETLKKLILNTYIDGAKIISIEYDPFVPEQINIITDKSTISSFGDIGQVIYRLRDTEESVSDTQDK